MTVIIGRRELLAALGSAAAAWPLAARAQQPAMPVIGLLSGSAPGASPHLVAAFRRGLGMRGLSTAKTWRSITTGPMVASISARSFAR